MVAVGIILAIAIIAATIALVAARRMEAKYLAPLILVGAVAGFLVANITSIKELSLKLTGIGELTTTVNSLKTDVTAVQENQGSLAKVAAENELLLSKTLAASATTRSYSSLAEANVDKLAQIAVRDPQTRARWLSELRARIR